VRRRSRLLDLVAPALLCAAFLSTAAGAQQRATLNVLFIGDSYTFFNNLGDVLAGVANGVTAGPAIRAELAVAGGMPLGWHLANGPAMSMLRESRWDHVVLQEHSLFGGLVIQGERRFAPARLFHESARVMVERVREQKAMPVFMMTWATRGWPDEEAVLTSAYLDIGGELNAPVAAVGSAFALAQRRGIATDLLAPDGGHPSPAGSYLAACVIYSTITGRSPKGAPAVIEGAPWSRSLGAVDRSQRVRLVELPPDAAAQLQGIAWEVASTARLIAIR
jgi:hypothetical protein